MHRAAAGVARSWVANGPNQAISPDQITRAFGSSPALAQLAARAGLNTQDLAQKLSEALPAAIDKLTPNGALPGKGSG